MDSIVTIVLSFDMYSDLWDTYFQCKEKFWHSSMQTYLVTNKKKPSYKNVVVITTGAEISWSRRARTAVNKVNTQYVLLMLEDYYITTEVTDEIIKPLVSFMRERNADYLRIYPFPEMHFPDKGDNGIHIVPADSLYGVNLQASIWEKEYLLKLLDDGDFSAWEFEARQKNGAATQIPGSLYTLDYAPFEMVNGVLQGQWYSPSVKKLRKLGIQVDTSRRAILPWTKVIEYKTKISIRKIIGPQLVRMLKPFLKKLGVKFVTD